MDVQIYEPNLRQKPISFTSYSFNITGRIDRITKRGSKLLHGYIQAMLEVDKNVLTPQSSLQFAPCDQFPRPLEQRDKQVPDFGFEPDFQSELAQLDASEVGLVRTEPVQLPSRRR